jgi:integrase
MDFINMFKKIIVKENNTIKFKEIALEWLEYKKISVKKSTYYNYMFIVNKYLISYFGEKRIISINNFNTFIQELSLKLSPKTVRDIICVLKAILNYYENKYGCKLNYKKINAPKIEKVHIKILSDKERLKIENYCLENKTLNNLGIILCLNTGLRIGELCALKWKNIDLAEKNIYVTQTIQRVYNTYTKDSVVIIDTPKTDCSVRCIPINKKIYTLLKEIKKNYSSDAFFLTGSAEQFIEPRRYQYLFKKTIKSLNIKPFKFHVLRHTFATNCIDVGMDIKSLSELLGHSTVEVTLNRYVHSSLKMKQRFLEKL